MSSNSDSYLTITFINEEESSKSNEESSDFYYSNKILPFADSPLYYSTIISASPLTKGEDVKTVYDVTLNLKNVEHEFEPGDTIGILPCNDEEEVEQILLHLNLLALSRKAYNLCLTANTTKKKRSIPTHLPIKGTLWELFLKCLDIRTPPKKLFLKSLVPYTSNQEEARRLQHLCLPKGSQEYNEFILQNRGLLRVLKYFPSCCPPVAIFLENLPPLQPRPYSISSSPLFSNEVLHIAFAVINLEEDTKGVCTGWLEKCIKKTGQFKSEEGINTVDIVETTIQKLTISSEKETVIPFYFRKSNNFRLPVDLKLPIVMIGPGTGVAPFIGFLQHRRLETIKSHSNKKFGPTWLFYGCRYSDRDFLYKTKIEEFQSTGVLTKLFACYSREGCAKTYVQDIIKANGKAFVDHILHEQAVVYVCGDAKNMAKDVKNTIFSCLAEYEKWSAADSEIFLKQLEQSGRYIQDVWI